MKYSRTPREIPRAKPEGFPSAQAMFHRIYPDSSYNADILDYNSSINLPGDQYWKS